MFSTRKEQETVVADLMACKPSFIEDSLWSSACSRIHPLPHHGERVAEFRQRRVTSHPCMVYADGKPMEIITRPPHDAGHKHSYTVATPILVKHTAPVFEGVKKSKGSTTAAAPPTATSDIPQHFVDWTPHGKTVTVCVCKTEGKCLCKQDRSEDIRGNVKQFWFMPPSGCSAENLFSWPLSSSCGELINANNWGVDTRDPKQNEAYLSMVRVIVMTSWTQCWALLMGRFLYHAEGGARQTWPMLIRVHEIACTLYKDHSEPWVYPGLPPARTCSKVSQHFTVFTRLSMERNKLGRWPRPTDQDVKEHTDQWLSFLTMYSLADVIFAWCIMNHNTESALKWCTEMAYKCHQFWLTRHYAPHQLHYTNAEQKVLKPHDTEYVVIQNTQFPLVQFPNSRLDMTVMVLSNPVIRPGAPLYSCDILSLAELRRLSTVEVVQQFGHAAHISALNLIWTLAAAVTVNERDKIFFRKVFTADNEGLFNRILDVCHSPTPAMHADASIPVTSSSTSSRIYNTRTHMRIAGLGTCFTGARNEGRVVHMETETAQEFAKKKGPGYQWLMHVGDGRPLCYDAHKPYMGYLTRLIDCPLDDALAEFKWLRNSQSYYAPDASVDLARFYLYACTILQTPKRIMELQQHACNAGIYKILQGPNSMGMAYFQLAFAAPDLSEYDLWFILLLWFMTHEPPAIPVVGRMEEILRRINQSSVVRFWYAFVRAYHRYITRVTAACARWLQLGLGSIGDTTTRREAFHLWLQMERYVTEHRLAAWDFKSPETTTLLDMLRQLCRGSLARWCQFTFDTTDGSIRWPQLRWMLFFFLTHILQPACLPPDYFSESTTPDQIQRLRLMYDPNQVRRGPGDDLMDLQKAFCYSLAVGTRMMSDGVQQAWARYTCRASTSATAQGDANNESVMAIRIVDEMLRSVPTDATGFMRLLEAYATIHTTMIFVRVAVPKPNMHLVSFNDFMELEDDDTQPAATTAYYNDNARKVSDDDLLMNALEDLLEATVLVYVLAQSPEEVAACERVYAKIFTSDTIETISVAESVQPVPAPIMDKEGFEWRRGEADWSSRSFRAYPKRIGGN